MAAGGAVSISGGIVIDDHTAELINRMAEKFFAKPENVKKFEEWHLKTYGCLPEKGGKNNGR